MRTNPKPLNPDAEPFVPLKSQQTFDKPHLPSSLPPAPTGRSPPAPPPPPFMKFRVVNQFNVQSLPRPRREKAWRPHLSAKCGGAKMARPTSANRGSKKIADSAVGPRGKLWREASSPVSVWIPKKKDNVLCVFSSYSFRPLPPPTGEDDDDGGKTTLMIRNIPNRFRRHMLVEFLDLFCKDQNEKTDHQLVKEEKQIRYEYDFLYLPMDFHSGDNFGYAFVNFTSAMAAKNIRGLLHNQGWSDFKDSFGTLRSSKKIREINWARIQGKEELIKHFQKSNFACKNQDYQPVVFAPPRDGNAAAATAFSVPFTVGHCVLSSLSSSTTTTDVDDEIETGGAASNKSSESS